MIERRQFIFGAASLVTASAAEALRPRQRLSLLQRGQLESITPRKFGRWSEVAVGEVVQPREEGTLTAKLYSQVLGRVYRNDESGDFVMLAIAYGDTQSDLLQLHRPESCYPAFGFTISPPRMAELTFGDDVYIPIRTMIARASDRVESVSYWTRIGEFLPTTQMEQRVDKLKAAIAGVVPDGILVRCSILGRDGDRNFRVNSAFLQQLVLGIEPQYRAAFVGSKLASSLSRLNIS